MTELWEEILGGLDGHQKRVMTYLAAEVGRYYECREAKIKFRRDFRTTGTNEWGGNSQVKRVPNIYNGCTNGCRYCYGRPTRRMTEEEWAGMTYNENGLKAAKKIARGREKYGDDFRLMWPTSHDITPETYHECAKVLKILVEADIEVLVTTKPSLAVVDKLTTDFADRRDKIQFRFTITSIDDRIREYHEPNAPPVPERLSALRLAYERGWKTSISCEPFLEDPTELIKVVRPWVTESFWVGPMNKAFCPEEDWSDLLWSPLNMFALKKRLDELGWDKTRYKDTFVKQTVVLVFFNEIFPTMDGVVAEAVSAEINGIAIGNDCK